MSAAGDRMGRLLSRWVRVMLRARWLVIGLALIGAVLAADYASTRLGIDTDTADMISDELPWRQHFIAFRETFPARDRNVVVAVEAETAVQAERYAADLVRALEANPQLFASVLAEGVGEFFERNALLFASTEQLESLADRLIEAQPLIGMLSTRFDGAAVLEVAARAAGVGATTGDGGADAGAAGVDASAARAEAGAARGDASDAGAAAALHAELAETIAAAASGESRALDWRRLMLGGSSGGAGDRIERRLVVFQPELDFDRMQPAAAALDALHTLLDELDARYPGVDAGVTGTVAMEHEEMLSVRAGAVFAGIASLVMVLLALYAALRSVRLVAVALATLVVGLTGTAAFAAAAVGHLNLLSVAFAVLYVGLGIDFIFHLCLRVTELLGEGVAVDDAIVTASGDVGESLVVCALTTAAGFYAFIPTDFQGVSELGLISGTGMFISFVVSFTLLPALLGVALGERDRRVRRAWLPARMLEPLTSKPRVVVAVTVAVTAASLWWLPRAEFDSNPINLRDPAAESVRTLDRLARSGDAPIYNLVAVADDAPTAAAWAERLATQPAVRDVTTASALVPAEQSEKQFVLEDLALVLGPGFGTLDREAPDAQRMAAALSALDASLAQGHDVRAGALRAALADLERTLGSLEPDERKRRLLELDTAIVGLLPAELARLEEALTAEPFEFDDLPPPLAERWVSAGGRQIVEIAPAERVSDPAAASRFVDAVRSVVPTATGLPVVYQEASATVVRSFQTALGLALVFVTALLFVFLRSVKDTLYVIVPILIACVVTAGATAFFGMPFNFANVITLPLLVGIGVDNGIHVVHRIRLEPAKAASPFRTSTAVAVLASGLTTVASFGNLAFSPHQGMASMGQMLTLGVAVVLLATLVFLPALLKLGGPR